MPERSDAAGTAEPPGLSLEGMLQRDAFVLAAALAASVGEVVGVVGGVGSGKSTLLAALAGRLRLTSGRLVGPDGVWDDLAAGRWRPEAERPVAYLPARPTLADDITALDQVIDQERRGDRGGEHGRAVASVAGRAGSDPTGADAAVAADARARAAAEATLEALGLTPAVYRRDGWTLSGGETQRVALARCLATGAAVVVLDDPFAALDGRTRVTVRQWLAGRLATRSAIVVLACSDPADTHLLADRVVPLG